MSLKRYLNTLHRLLIAINRRQQETALRLSVAETATENVARRLEYVEDRLVEVDEIMRCLIEVAMKVRAADVTERDTWVLAAARDWLERGR